MKLIGINCTSCGFKMLESPEKCPNCGSEKLEEYSFEGSAKISTFTVVMVGFGHLSQRTPYVLAIVELKEGLKVLTIVEDIDLNSVEMNQPVKFKRFEEGTGPIFQPN
jgi:uncharacterized protein